MSQSGAGRPPQPYPGLLMCSPGNWVAQHPLPQHCQLPVPGFCAPRPPPDSTHLQAWGEKSHCSDQPAEPPCPAATQPCPHPRHRCPWACLSIFSAGLTLPLTWASSLTPGRAEVCGLQLERTERIRRKLSVPDQSLPLKVFPSPVAQPLRGPHVHTPPCGLGPVVRDLTRLKVVLP